MNRKILLLLTISFICTSLSYSQMSDSDAWKSGESSYAPKTKDMWELGLHFGNYSIVGDVQTVVPSLGLGLHLRKSLGYVFSLRTDFFYGRARGFDGILRTHSSVGGGLNDNFLPYQGLQSGYFVSYRTTSYYGAVQGIFNLGNILFHQKENKWNLYTAVGLGLHGHETWLDLTDGSGNAYSDLSNRVNYSSERAQTREGRRDFRNAARDIYNGEYDTKYENVGRSSLALGDAQNLNIFATLSFGVSRKLSQRVNIGLEHQINYVTTDELDGVIFASRGDRTTSNDYGHYTNIRVGINIGKMSNRTEPKYWMNPMDPVMNDMAELKRRPVLDLTDSDGDGVIDMLDQEPNSPPGARVDTRGVTLDSDGDGIPDHLDKEPFSPPGFPVDKDGVAQVPQYTTENDVERIVENKLNIFKNENRCGNWFLPSINFDLDRARLRPESHLQLQQVAHVMNMCPNICVSVVGHTDVRGSEAHNDRLSYRRAKAIVDHLVDTYKVDRNRFKLMYDGKRSLLIPGTNREAEHFVNRRVELRVCRDNDKEMEAPAEKK
jgi:OmpA-OmpF porin, OOP family